MEGIVDFNHPLFLHPSDKPRVHLELSVGIVFASSTALPWQDLKERFDKVNGLRIFFLHRSIVTLNQELDFSYATTSVNQAYSIIVQEESHVCTCLEFLLWRIL
ncbi:hypothetical protein V6Z12_D01G221800 [Gossypium hirsutum]